MLLLLPMGVHLCQISSICRRMTLSLMVFLGSMNGSRPFA